MSIRCAVTKSELCVVYSGNGGRLRTCSVRRVGMPRAARLFKYGQCALKERPRLRIVALVPKQVREVVEGRGRVGMLRPQRVFAYGKGITQ